MCNVDASIFHMVNQPVFLIDTAAVFTLESSLKRFGFTDSAHAPIAFNILNELIDSFYYFFVLCLPIDVVFPCII